MKFLTILLVFIFFIFIFMGVYYIAITPNLLVAVPISIGIGFLTGLLFVIGHDAGHYSIFNGKRSNNILAQLCFLPSAQSRIIWQHAHNQLHHGYTNLRQKDLNYPPLTIAEYEELSFLEKAYYRVKRTIPGLFLIYLIDVWLFNLFNDWAKNNRKKHRYELVLIALYYLFIISIVLIFAADSIAMRLLFATVLPFIVWNYLVAFLTYLNHTHPEVPWFDDYHEWRKFDKSTLTVHVVLPEWLDMGFLRIMQHPVHHKNAKIAWFELKQANQELHQQRKITKAQLTWKNILLVFRECQLYDYSNKRWVGYPH